MTLGIKSNEAQFFVMSYNYVRVTTCEVHKTLFDPLRTLVPN